jgi:hypothetical protein
MDIDAGESPQPANPTSRCQQLSAGTTSAMKRISSAYSPFSFAMGKVCRYDYRMSFDPWKRLQSEKCSTF